MQTISIEEFRKRYGTVGISQFSQQSQSRGIGGTIKDAFKSGIGQVKSGMEKAGRAKNPVELFEGSLKMGAGAIGAAFSPLAPVIEPTVGRGINYAADKIINNPTVQS